MKYDEINDYDLLDKVSENELATEALYEKYKPMINKISTQAYYKNTNLGIELNDLIQEGMIGFSIAINTFDDSKETSFYTFARMCIIRRILSYISMCSRQKHQLLNESISVEAITGNQNIEKVLEDLESNPEKVMISDENTKELIRNIEEELTSFECEVFELKTAGFSNKEIGDLLEKDSKSIYNALNRIKAKIQELKKEV